MDSQHIQKRSIYWRKDSKSDLEQLKFLQWIGAGQKDGVCRLLPIDSFYRLIHAVTEISKHEKADVFMIDYTRTQGEKTSFNNMFEAIEGIKNRHIVSTMYRRYTEII